MMADASENTQPCVNPLLSEATLRSQRTRGLSNGDALLSASILNGSVVPARGVFLTE